MKKFKISPVLPGIAVLMLSGSLVCVSPAMAQSSNNSAAPAATMPDDRAPQGNTTSAQPAQTSNELSAQAGSSSKSADANDASSYATGSPLQGQSKEGFWGHLNPFARKKWVAKQVDPIRDRENELDQLQARNARDIKDVDSRAQAGISKAMNAANTADQHAAAAAQSAQQAQTVASDASTRTDTLGTTVNNLDQYKAVNSVDVPFARGRTTLGPQGKADLDQVAQTLDGQKGYIVEVEGFSRSGVAPSQAMADSVVRYLVEEHQVPIYRIFRTGMGRQTQTASAASTADNAQMASNDSNSAAPITNGVRVTLMQNSLGSFNSNGSQPGAQPSNGAAAAPNGSQSSNAPVSTNTMAAR